MTKADDYNQAEITGKRLTIEHITQLVRTYQRANNLTPDGMAGPKTRAVIEVDMSEGKPPTPDPDAILKAAGIGAVEIARNLWASDIYDPKENDHTGNANRCKLEIDNMIRYGLGWTWEPFYRGDGWFEWCGAFVAKTYPSMRALLRKAFLASTYRLDRFARYQPIEGYENPKPSTGPYRQIANLDEKSKTVPWEPRAGDVVLHGPSGYGKHICLVESFNAQTGTFHTIEGNGTGSGPHGERQHGVVKGARKLGGFAGPNEWHIRRLIRFAPSDLIPT